MTSQSVNAPIASPNAIIERVWYGGTDALLEGEGVCYNTDYGTAADVDGSRANRVERPSTSNNFAFAGVASQNYAASSVGQFIIINVPGSKGINIAVGGNPTIDTGMLTFQVAGGAGAGRFVKAGFPGRGSARPAQTQASAVVTSDLVGTAWSLANDGITLTHASATVLAGDTVVLLAGVAEDAAIYIVRGAYTVASVTSGTVCVLSSTAHAATASGAMDCIGYIYRTNPLCQADLLTGEESCGVEFVNIIDGGNADSPHMVGGVTYVPGGITITAAIDFNLADGTRIGEKKGFWVLGALTTSDVTVTPDSAATTMAGGALTNLATMDAAGDAGFLQYWGEWNCIGISGGTTEA